MKRALICGISGQDETYLAQILLNLGYEVWGTSRDAQVTNFYNLITIGIKHKVKLVSMALNDFRSVLQVLTLLCKPDEIYNLAGQSSVGLSFEQPVETLESIATGTLNLLEAIRFLKEKHMGYLLVQGFYLTTSLRYDQKDSSLKKLFQQLVVLLGEQMRLCI